MGEKLRDEIAEALRAEVRAEAARIGDAARGGPMPQGASYVTRPGFSDVELRRLAIAAARVVEDRLVPDPEDVDAILAAIEPLLVAAREDADRLRAANEELQVVAATVTGWMERVTRAEADADRLAKALEATLRPNRSPEGVYYAESQQQYLARAALAAHRKEKGKE